VVFTLNAHRLKIEYKDESALLFTEEWEIDKTTGQLSGTARNNPAIPLTLIAKSYAEAMPPAKPAPLTGTLPPSIPAPPTGTLPPPIPGPTALPLPAGPRP
jgi:hypothetical protein